MIIHPGSSSEAVVGMLEEEKAHSIAATSKQTTTTPSLAVEEDSTEGSFYADDDSTCASSGNSPVAAACELPSPQEPSGLFEKSSVEESESSDDIIVKDFEDPYNKSKSGRTQPLLEESITEASTSNFAPRPLKSSLRSSGNSTSSSSSTKIRLRRKPRVHGLWNEDKTANPFAMLHDPLLLQIFTSFLDLQDLCRCQGVSRRFASLAQHEEAWRHIDATCFMEASYQHFQCQKHSNPAQATTELLVQTWQSKAPESIRIDNIRNRLEANSFCLPTNTKRLQMLSLSQFDDLTDTNVHVLLLSSKTARGSAISEAATKNCTPATAQSRNRINRRRSSMTHPWALQQLALSDCPRLTNASLRSVANMCHQLRELNVAGCRLMDDLSALQPLWKCLSRAGEDGANDTGSAKMAEVLTLSDRCGGSSTASAHASPAPNVKKTANLGSLFVPPSQAPHTGVTSLGSLFAPPPPPPAAAAIRTKPAAAAAASSPPNVKKTDSLGSLFTPRPPPQNVARGGGLGSLFAPPSAAALKKPSAASSSSTVKKLSNLGGIKGLVDPPHTAPKTPPFTSSINGLAGLFAPAASPFTQKNNTIPKGSLPLKPSTNQVAPATNLGSLFLPSVNATSKSPPTNTTTKAPPSTSNGSLGSLIAIPGTADAVKSNVDFYSSHKNTIMFSNSSPSLASLDQAPKVKVGNELCRLDISHTGVTPDMLIRCLTDAASQGVGAGFVVAFESLIAANSGNHKNSYLWNDSHLRALARAIDASALKNFDISSCRDADTDEGVEGRVTDAGLLSLFFGLLTEDESSTKSGRFLAAVNAPMLQLAELGLVGNSLVTKDALDNIRDASMATNLTVRL